MLSYRQVRQYQLEHSRKASPARGSQILVLGFAGIIILGYMWPGHKYFASLTPGENFLNFAMLTSAARLFLEAFRDDSTPLPGGLRLAQIVSWLILAACLYAKYNLKIDSNST